MKCFRKIIKTRNGFLEGQKTVKLINYLNKILFQTTTHKLGADPEIFHEGGGGTKNTHKSNEVDKVPPDPSPRATTGSTDMAKIICIITHY